MLNGFNFTGAARKIREQKESLCNFTPAGTIFCRENIQYRQNIQGVSEGTVNILGGSTMDYFDQLSSYKHVSNFQ